MTTAISGMTRLLVPLDGRDPSVRAVPVAGRIAERLGLSIHLLSITDDDVSGRQAWLESVRAHARDAQVTAEVVEGSDPEVAVLAAATEDTLVCMATAASLLPHDGRFGSLTERVARDLARPMFVVGPKMLAHPGSPTRKVVVPVDGSNLSEAALPVATDLARRLDVPMGVVSVVTPGNERSAQAHLGGNVEVMEANYVRRLARDAATEFGVQAEFEVLHTEDTAEAIVDFAGDDGTIVMTTHGRSGISRLFGGSVTTAVVAQSPRAVVIYRPED